MNDKSSMIRADLHICIWFFILFIQLQYQCELPLSQQVYERSGFLKILTLIRNVGMLSLGSSLDSDESEKIINIVLSFIAILI